MTTLTVDADILRQLTIFLMTADPVYQERQLSLIRDWGSHIVVLDGSEKPQQDLGTESRDNHRITYFHDKSVINRFRFAGERKPTSYAMIMSDDDVFVKSGVVAGLQKLRENPNLGSVIGPACFLHKSPYQKNLFGLSSCEGGQITYMGGRLDWCRKEPSTEQRILAHAFPYQTRLSYGVSRGHILQKVTRHLGKIPHRHPAFPSSPSSFELLLEFLTLRAGPATSTPHLYWLRSLERVISPKEGSPDFIESNLDWFTWLRSAKIEGFDRDFARVLSDELHLDDWDTETITAAIFDVFPLNKGFNPLYTVSRAKKSLSRPASVMAL